MTSWYYEMFNSKPVVVVADEIRVEFPGYH